MERVRNGSHARQGGQRRHRLLHREHGSHGRAYGRLHHRRADPDVDGPRISGHARRLHPRTGEDRHRHGRIQRAVGDRPAHGTAHHHRDESARVAFVRARLQGDGLPDRENRRAPGGGLYAGRTAERHYAQDARGVRAGARLCRRESAAVRLREIPRRGYRIGDADEGRGRGHGDRAHLQTGLSQGVALPGGALALP